MVTTTNGADAQNARTMHSIAVLFVVVQSATSNANKKIPLEQLNLARLLESVLNLING